VLRVQIERLCADLAVDPGAEAVLKMQHQERFTTVNKAMEKIFTQENRRLLVPLLVFFYEWFRSIR
jgi:hypothetical protein